MDRTEFRRLMDERTDEDFLSVSEWQEIAEEQTRQNGVVGTVVIAIEEMAELTKELTKFLRHREQVQHFDMSGLIEEMTDVTICISELNSLFGDEVPPYVMNKALDIKLRRLKEDEDGNT